MIQDIGRVYLTVLMVCTYAVWWLGRGQWHDQGCLGISIRTSITDWNATVSYNGVLAHALDPTRRSKKLGIEG